MSKYKVKIEIEETHLGKFRLRVEGANTGYITEFRRIDKLLEHLEHSIYSSYCSFIDPLKPRK